MKNEYVSMLIIVCAVIVIICAAIGIVACFYMAFREELMLDDC